MEKLLTICTAAYNAEETIEKMLTSLLTSEHKDLIEIIVVDDGSIDTTGTIVSQYVKKYPRIIKLISQENEGSGAARNRAFSSARGKYLKIVDADDYVNTENFDKFIMQLNDIDADIIWNGYYRRNVVLKKNKEIDLCKGYLKPLKIYNIRDEIRLPDYYAMHGTTYRTEVFRKGNIHLSPGLSYVDTEYLLYPLPFINKVVYIDASFYVYNVGMINQSVSPKKRIENEAKINMLLEKLDDYSNKYIAVNEELFSKILAVAYMIKYRLFLAKSDFREKAALVEFDQNLKLKKPRVWDLLGKNFKYVRIFRSFNYYGYYLMIIVYKASQILRKE